MQTAKRGNIYVDSKPPLFGERFDTLLLHDNLQIERIISSDVTASLEYCQAQDEWVVLLQGEAVLDVAGESVELKAGDYVFIASGVRHEVKRVTPGTLWLAVHLHPTSQASSLSNQ